MENNSTNASFFEFRDRLIRKYESLSRSFVKIQALGVKHRADAEHDAKRFWTDPLLQITPMYEQTGTVQDLSYHGEQFPYVLDRRAELPAELDARYARLYGLISDELRCIFDPSDAMSPSYPLETFRFLKERGLSEYRIRRLVLEAWGREEVTR